MGAYSTLILALAAFTATAATVQGEVDIRPSYEVTYGPDFQYEFKVSLYWNPELPACDPSALPIEWLISTDKKTAKKTGVKTIGINYNPCGHPSLDHFGVSHFDLHMYTRGKIHKMQCGGAPVCLPDNPLAKKFFKPLTRNTIDGFLVDAIGVPAMGTHVLAPPTTPAAQWKIPTLIIGQYNGELVFYESMFPKRTFDENVEDTQEIVWNHQTMNFLPTSQHLKADKNTMTAVVTYHGQVKVNCKKLKKNKCTTHARCVLVRGKCRPHPWKDA